MWGKVKKLRFGFCWIREGEISFEIGTECRERDRIIRLELKFGLFDLKGRDFFRDDWRLELRVEEELGFRERFDLRKGLLRCWRGVLLKGRCGFWSEVEDLFQSFSGLGM